MNGTETLPWEVSQVYAQAVTVAVTDCDLFGHTNNVIYLSWLERIAWAHSESLGMSFGTYERLGCGCVARRHELDYLARPLQAICCNWALGSPKTTAG